MWKQLGEILMALRLNLYGCHIEPILSSVGSGSSQLLEAAIANLAKPIPGDEGSHKKSVLWLTTLIRDGYPNRGLRPEPAEPDDGGLLVSLSETQVHVSAMHALTMAVRGNDCVDLSMDSSTWQYSAIVSLDDQLKACGFTRSSACSIEFLRSLGAIIEGAPIFGDCFCTEWSFYCFLPKSHLFRLITTLAAAIDYRREIPEYVPPDVREKMLDRLSDPARSFATVLSEWFQKIADAGQDAYIIWW